MKNLLKKSLLALLIASGSVWATAQVPVFNSYPSATAVIFLDFDGHVVSGTAWNSSGPINCNGSGLNTSQVTEVFNRVAEDFRPFNVNISTDPAKYSAAPVNRRVRVIITTSHEWYGNNAGGVAFLNSFTWGDDTPAFVFSALHNYNIKNISEASSHEAGHTLGLRHQSHYDANCVKLSDYHWGQGSGEIGWAPIMGAGYSQNMTLWHNGPNSLGCTNYQTDLSIITNATNGFGYRADDFSELMNNNTTLAPWVDNQFTVSGVIERTDDKDVFRFVLPNFGRFMLNGIPYNVGTGNAGSDLDLQVELFDANLASIGIYNPGTLLSSIVDTLMNAGTYYLRVDGKGNIYAPEYGSLGSYSMQGAFQPNTPLPLRRLELKGWIDREQHQLQWLIDADETVIRQELEVSADGRHFTLLTEPGSQARNYSYRSLDNKPLRYRIKVTFDNHKQYYSNTIALRPGQVLKPMLAGNNINSGSLNVMSPASFRYEIMDAGGRLLQRGNSPRGSSTIEVGNLPAGVYLVRFHNGSDQYTEKFLKQ